MFSLIWLDLTDTEKFSWDIQPTFKYKVKKVISLVFALSVIGSPSLAWGWGGEGGCSYSKDKTNQETKTEPVEETDA